MWRALGSGLKLYGKGEDAVCCGYRATGGAMQGFGVNLPPEECNFTNPLGSRSHPTSSFTRMRLVQEFAFVQQSRHMSILDNNWLW